ncbi:MAG: pentapeptide repeat-containing protein [Oligoflexales bacterium]
MTESTTATHSSETPAAPATQPEVRPSEVAIINCAEDLESVLELHKTWIESVLDPARPVQGGRANLKGANLDGFDLEGRDLRGASMQRVSLRGANLKGANLTGCDLSQADLEEADLSRAKLRRAVLQNASLIGARLDDTDFLFADLKFCRRDQKET